MPTKPDCDELMLLLDDECTALQAFVAALGEEQQILARSASVAALPAIVERKATLYEQLNELGKARGAWLAGHRLPAIAAAFGSDPALGRRWARIVDLARAARRCNETNGRLVRTRMTYNKSALDAIRAARGSAPAVYGADGRI